MRWCGSPATTGVERSISSLLASQQVDGPLGPDQALRRVA